MDIKKQAVNADDMEQLNGSKKRLLTSNTLLKELEKELGESEE